MTKVILRPATIDDIPTLNAWDERPHVAEASGSDDGYDWAVEVPRQVGWRWFLIAEIDGRAIGFIQIIAPLEEESHYWGDVAPNLRAIDIWIGEEDCLGQGYGRQMMQLAIDHCFAAPEVTAILIDPLASNLRAHRFYERLGFEFIERRFFDADDCFVYRLERASSQSRKAP